MRRTMIRISVVLFTAFLACAVAGGTAQADEGDLPEQAWLVCPPSCDPPEDPEPELNCPPICADLFPDDLALDDPCPPDLCGPLPPGDPDEGEQNPPDEPTDEPTDEPASDQPDQDDGHRDDSDESAPDAPVSSTTNGAPSGPAVAPIADVAEQPSETSNGGLKAALLAIFAAAGLTAIGVLAYAVSRRR